MTNAIVYGGSFMPTRGAVSVQDGRIRALGETLRAQPGEEVFDAGGAKILPGFVDIHVHGGGGVEIGGGAAALEVVSRRLASRGVTSFCPTTMTAAPATLRESAAQTVAYMGKEAGAYIHGLHLEGPYISVEKRGAQDPAFIRPADCAELERLMAAAPVKLLGMAPEAPGALEAAGWAQSRCRVAMAHTSATYEQARAGLAAGFSHGTHLYCAMPPLHHRAPGAVAALLESESATAELICDGVHLHPATVRLAFRLLGEDRAVTVSDAVAAAGLPEGAHSVGGQTMICQNGAVYMADGETLAGSACDLFTEYQNLLAWGISESAALRSCTINPARVIGADAVCGSLAPGKNADLLLLDGGGALLQAMVKGRWCGGMP
jgi:N-acetylglucosamine-6-phosphate deacetylase